MSWRKAQKGNVYIAAPSIHPSIDRWHVKIPSQLREGIPAKRPPAKLGFSAGYIVLCLAFIRLITWAGRISLLRVYHSRERGLTGRERCNTATMRRHKHSYTCIYIHTWQYCEYLLIVAIIRMFQELNRNRLFSGCSIAIIDPIGSRPPLSMSMSMSQFLPWDILWGFRRNERNGPTDDSLFECWPPSNEWILFTFRFSAVHFSFRSFSIHLLCCVFFPTAVETHCRSFCQDEISKSFLLFFTCSDNFYTYLWP